MSKRRSRLWAVAAYFNPLGSVRRRENFRAFRERLAVPLVAAELSIDKEFELGVGDADRLVQIHGPSLMWQKERLLTLALREVPDACDIVAWLDADIVFERSNWVGATCDALDHAALVQPFERVFDLGPSADPQRLEPEFLDPRAALFKRRSFAASRHIVGDRSLRNQNIGHHSYSPGHAWAARREMLDGLGFYDRAVIGGADGLMAWAAVGLAEETARARRMGPAERRHYMAWANRWTHRVERRIDWIDGDIYHLWHGDLEDRRYWERHRILERHSFDPLTDIAEDPGGCWRWNSTKTVFHAEVRDYFERRNEDGLACAEVAV